MHPLATLLTTTNLGLVSLRGLACPSLLKGPQSTGVARVQKLRVPGLFEVLASSVLLCGLFGGANASEVTITSVLTQASHNHPSVKLRQSDVLAAQSELRGAEWGRYPSLGAELQAASGGGVTVARVTQPLWTGGRLTGQIAVAEANLTVSKALLAEAQQAIMLEATASFFEIQRVSERLVAAKANELEHRRLLETIQRRVKSEISPVTDATQAQARLQQAVAERLQFERQLETLRIGLEQIVGKLQGPLRPPSKIPMDQWSTDALLDAAKRYSPEMQRREAQIQAAGAQIITAKAAIMPQLSLQQEFKLGSLPAGTDRSRTYVSLSVQTGAGLSTFSAIDVVVARQQAARDGLEQNIRLLEQTVRTTWNDVNALTMQLKPSRDLLEASDDVVSSYLRQFQVGRKMWLDVLNAQREKTNARYALTDIETPLLFSKIRLLLLVGAIRPGSMDAIYE